MANPAIQFATDEIRRVRSDESHAETSALDLNEGIVSRLLVANQQSTGLLKRRSSVELCPPADGHPAAP